MIFPENFRFYYEYVYSSFLYLIMIKYFYRAYKKPKYQLSHKIEVGIIQFWYMGLTRKMIILRLLRVVLVSTTYVSHYL